MKRLLIINYIVAGLTFLYGQDGNPPEMIMKEFKPAGRIEALMDDNLSDEWLLVQLNLKNDSLFNLVNDILPEMELFSGPASYHRIMEPHHLKQVQNVLTDEFFVIVREDYQLPISSREFWIDVKQGSETQGTWSDDDAIEYTCSCLSNATDCIKLGWDESWWNPLDYWGEAWYGYAPPYYQSIEEIRVVVRGGQCDDLPIWSETYMGMMDDNGNWSHDYELSIDYTDNEFVVSNSWNGSMLMPRIGSEDNYCIDTIRLKFYYTCDEPDNHSDLVASDGADCFTVSLSWNLPISSITAQTLYRDNTVIAQLDSDDITYEDWGAQIGAEHTYCIEAQNECGSSAMICSIGSVKVAPEPPEDVNATNGEYSNHVQISWISSDNTDQYKIYRDGSWMGFVTQDVLEYTDLIPEMGMVYEYCIEAVNNCGQSDWNCDTGYTAEPGGDVNADGNIDVLDVVMVVNIILGAYEPSGDEFSASDVNNDGAIDILDVVMITNTIIEGRI